jgi:thiol-disulfide isomerase/thioredoxin
MTKVEKRVKLVKFGADWCGPCKSMARAQTLEKFAEAHPELELEVVDVDKDEERADDYDVQGIPCFVFEDLDGDELVRDEGATNAKGLEKLYKKALAELESDEDEDDEDDEDE